MMCDPAEKQGTSTADAKRSQLAESVDVLLDDHGAEHEECKRRANPAGFTNVRAHADAHLRAIAGKPADSDW